MSWQQCLSLRELLKSSYRKAAHWSAEMKYQKEEPVMTTKLIGTWKVLIKTPIDESKSTWRFWEEDGQVKGTITPLGEDTVAFEKVEVSGDDFELMTHLDLQFGHIQFDYKGTATDDTIMGISKMKMGKSKFKGKKVEE